MYENERLIFQEHLAERINYSEIPGTKRKELVRKFKAPSTELHRATALAFANAFVSAKNAEASKTIQDPQADGKGTTPAGTAKNQYAGLWRHVGTSWDGRVDAYVQVLRFGWASSLLSNNAPNDECMIRQGSDVRADSRTLTLYWHSIADTKVKACMDELRAAAAFTDPTVQGTKHTGKYLVGEIVPEQAEDGSYTVTVTLTRVVVVTSSVSLATLTPIRSRVRDINNPFGREGGYTSHEGRAPTEGIVCVYRALDASSRTALEAITDAQLHGLLSQTDQQKFETVKKEIAEAEGNTLTLTVTYRWVPLATTAPEAAARLISFGLSNQSGKLTLKRSWPRMNPAYVQAIIQGTDAEPNANVVAKNVTNPQADGKTYSGGYMARLTQGEMTEDDGCELVQELTLAGDADVDVYLGPDSDTWQYEKYLFDASETAVNGFLAAATFPATNKPVGFVGTNPNWGIPEDGVTKSKEITHNADGSLNLHASWAKVKSRDSGEYELARGAVTEIKGRTLLNLAKEEIPSGLGAGESQKVEYNGKGGWNVQKIKQSLREGQSVKTWESSSETIEDPKQWTEKVPSRFNGVINGYFVYIITVNRTQIKTSRVIREFSLSMPAADVVGQSTNNRDGSSTNNYSKVVPLAPELWCKETTLINFTAWSPIVCVYQLAGTLSP